MSFAIEFLRAAQRFEEISARDAQKIVAARIDSLRDDVSFALNALLDRARRRQQELQSQPSENVKRGRRVPGIDVTLALQRKRSFRRNPNRSPEPRSLSLISAPRFTLLLLNLAPTSFTPSKRSRSTDGLVSIACAKSESGMYVLRNVISCSWEISVHFCPRRTAGVDSRKPSTIQCEMDSHFQPIAFERSWIVMP